MLVRNKKVFTKGMVLIVAFLAVLYYMFTPSFNGTNAFHASDNLFNSISKGSTYYMPQVAEGAKKFDGQSFEVTIFDGKDQFIPSATTILAASGMTVTPAGAGITVSGDLGMLMAKSVEDSDSMFRNDGQTLTDKYGMDARQALYVWWMTLKEVKSGLDQQKVFAPAIFLDSSVMKRAVEVGYNYYGIEGQKAMDRWGILLFSLIFYVVYTLWWGYGIFYLCEGLGLEMKAGKKKEM